MRRWPPEGSWLPSAIGSVLGRLSLTLEQTPLSQAQCESNRGREESDPFGWETDLQSSPTQASSWRSKMTEWQELYWRRWKKDYSYALIEKKILGWWRWVELINLAVTITFFIYCLDKMPDSNQVTPTSPLLDMERFLFITLWMPSL